MRLLLTAIALGLAPVFLIAQGNVGIGTTTPEVKLHVSDVFDVANGASGAFVNIQNATTTSPLGTLSGVRFRLDGVDAGINARYKGGILFEKTSAWGVGSLHFVTNSSGNNNSVTLADSRMTINSIGNVGIGNTTPTLSRLDVVATNNGISTRSSTTSSGLGMFVVGANFPTFGYNVALNGSYDYIGNGYGSMFQYNTTTGDLHFFTSNISGTSGASVIFNPAFFTLDVAGRVGVGTSTPTAKMHVNGTMVIGAPSITPATGYQLSVDGKIISEELKVQLQASWPDYVFGDNYQLMPISELERSIRQNKHLPNIPSAAKVNAQNGFEVGDMSRRLLEKVEELTLYIIQLKKENDRMEERLKKLEDKSPANN